MMMTIISNWALRAWNDSNLGNNDLCQLEVTMLKQFMTYIKLNSPDRMADTKCTIANGLLMEVHLFGLVLDTLIRSSFNYSRTTLARTLQNSSSNFRKRYIFIHCYLTRYLP